MQNYASEKDTKVSNIIISYLSSYMFRALTELKSDVIVVDKLLETTSTANYSKSTHRIKNEHMQNMSLLSLYITHLVACQCNELHVRATNLIFSSYNHSQQNGCQ